MLGTLAEATAVVRRHDGEAFAEGSTVIGSGCSRTAYRSEKSGVVYKVGMRKENDREYMLILRSYIAARVWGSTPVEGVRVPRVARFRVDEGTPNEQTVIAMEFVPHNPPSNLRSYKQDVQDWLAVKDIHMGNVRIDDEGNEVIIDLGYGNPEWDIITISEYEQRNLARRKAWREDRKRFEAEGFTVTECQYCAGCGEFDVHYQGVMYNMGAHLPAGVIDWEPQGWA